MAQAQDEYLHRAPALPPDIDEHTPNAARMYDYFLGGAHNFTADRELGDEVLAAFPAAREFARHNRAWLRRVVRDALAAGVRQFLDIGSGMPTMGNVHEIVRGAIPPGERATVVYVDYEPVAVQHSRIILDRDAAAGWATVVQEDLRDPSAVLGNPETSRLIDLDQPVLLMMIFILHFVGPADQPADLVACYRDRLAPGSRLAISHGSTEIVARDNPTDADRVRALYQNSSNPIWPRDRDEIRGWFGGWPLLYYPDLVHLPDWRPEPNPEPTPADREARQLTWCGVATKP
jgi:hypothetical protein